jgi:ADP-ribose pyrophosphatase
MYLYCPLSDLPGSGGTFGLEHEAEDILLHVLPQGDVFTWFEQGQFNNAATTICLMWLRANCDHIAESVH